MEFSTLFFDGFPKKGPIINYSTLFKLLPYSINNNWMPHLWLYPSSLRAGRDKRGSCIEAILEIIKMKTLSGKVTNMKTLSGESCPSFMFPSPASSDIFLRFPLLDTVSRPDIFSHSIYRADRQHMLLELETNLHKI